MNESKTEPAVNRAQWAMVALIFCVAGSSLWYRWLTHHHLEQTAALFIGLPASLAIALALMPRAKSALGMILKGITLFLLISGILLGEGFICILMAAPLFYLVGIVVGVIIDRVRKNKGRGDTTLRVMLLLLLPLSFEGTHPALSFSRAEIIRVEKTVVATPAEIEARLAVAPRFSSPLPYYLRAGFPRPEYATGSGLSVGSRRLIHFAGGEGAPGDLVMQVTAAGPAFVRFERVSDSSHISHWLDWQSGEMRWESLPDGKVRVRWELRYERRLDPAWYFGPWERYATAKAAAYFLDEQLAPHDHG